MKASVDTKFLVTAGATFVVLVFVVALVNRLAGTPAASVAGAVAGAVAIKLFDKLEYTPSTEIRFGAPLISVPWIYSAIAAVLMLYGSTIASDIAGQFWGITASSTGRCSSAALVTVSALQWLGFIVAGWVIGRLFPTHALSLASLAGLVLVIATMLDPRLGSPEQMGRFWMCLFGSPPTPEEALEDGGSLRIGVIVGLIARAYIALFVARLAARRSMAAASQ